MRTEFDEARGPGGVDPLDAQRFTVEPDFDGIDLRLGWAKTDLSPTEFERLGSALSEIFRWVIHGEAGARKLQVRDPRQIGIRFIGLAWTLNPDFFEGAPSLSEISRQVRKNKVVVSIHSAQARRDFGIRNRAASHAHNFKPNQPETDDASPAEFEPNEE